MIFFTVGTERFPFERMLRAAEEIGGKLREEVFIQTGSNRMRLTHCVAEPMLSFSGMKRRLGEARIVVSHAGVGALLLCALSGKNPILMPRLRRFGEHVDDHQRELAEKMAGLGHVLLAREVGEIVDFVSRFDEMQKKLKPFSSESPSLARTLAEYLL